MEEIKIIHPVPLLRILQIHFLASLQLGNAESEDIPTLDLIFTHIRIVSPNIPIIRADVIKRNKPGLQNKKSYK